MPNENKEVYKAEVLEVYSGDDLCLMVDLGVEGLHKKQRVRLQDVDTPNGIGAAADTEAGKVRAWVAMMTRNRKVTLTVTSRGGRNSWIGLIDLETPNGKINLNTELILQGYKFSR